MWRRLGLVVVAALAVFGCAQPQKPAAPLALGYHKHDCGPLYLGLKQTVECGTMVVAETRGANNGKTVELPVVIVRATATDKKPDPVIFLHGGPGGGIVDGVPFRLRKPGGMGIDDRDLIFFDQRGTGKSNPSFDCGDAPLSDAGVTSDDGVKVLSDCMAGWQAKGYDLTQYNSATIAKDIRDLRAALGITTYNLYGGSYGTRVAMAVMQHDPENLRAVVLNSTWPPEANATAPLPGYVSREVRQVLGYCAKDATCNGKYPDIEKRFDARMTDWLKTPVVKDGKTYTADEMAAFLLDEIYSDHGARSLPTTIDTVMKGDYSALDGFIKTQAGYTEGQFFTTLCNEEFPFEDVNAVKDDPKDPIATAVAHDTRRFFAVCKSFNPGTPDPVENQQLTSDIPTLMLSADIDAGCPAELSDEAIKTLSHAKSFFFPNRMHTIQGSDCSKKMVAQFLDTADPNVDATCIKTDRPAFPFIYDGK